MRNGVACVVANVEDQPVTVSQPLRVRHLVRHNEHLRQHLRVSAAEARRIVDMEAGND